MTARRRGKSGGEPAYPAGRPFPRTRLRNFPSRLRQLFSAAISVFPAIPKTRLSRDAFSREFRDRVKKPVLPIAGQFRGS
jgi:hypothetical protein